MTMKRKIATNIPASVLREAVKLTGKNQTATIIEGLEELILKKKREAFLNSRGKVSIDYDPAVSRGRVRKSRG